MRSFIASSLVIAFVSLAGCSTTHLKPSPPPVSVTTVLNLVKDELNAFAAMPSTATPNTGPCYAGGEPIDLVPVKVTATLKAVKKRENDPGVGLTAPIGIFSIDPSYSGAYSRSDAQTIVVPLMVPRKQPAQAVAPGDHDIARALAAFRDQIVMVDHAKTPCLQFNDGGMSNFKVSIVFDVVNQTTGGIGRSA